MLEEEKGRFPVRQCESPLVCLRRALEEPSPIAHAIQAALRQMVTRVGRQMVICFPSHHTRFFSRMQALWERCSI
jgi:hypothetical protein